MKTATEHPKYLSLSDTTITYIMTPLHIRTWGFTRLVTWRVGRWLGPPTKLHFKSVSGPVHYWHMGKRPYGCYRARR